MDLKRSTLRTPSKNRMGRSLSNGKSPRGILRASDSQMMNDIEVKLLMAEEKANIAADKMKRSTDNTLKRLAVEMANVHRLSEFEVRRFEVEKMFEQMDSEIEAVLKKEEERLSADLAEIERCKDKVNKLAKIIQQPWNAAGEPMKLEIGFIEKLKKDLDRLDEIATNIESE